MTAVPILFLSALFLFFHLVTIVLIIAIIQVPETFVYRISGSIDYAYFLVTIDVLRSHGFLTDCLFLVDLP